MLITVPSGLGKQTAAPPFPNRPLPTQSNQSPLQKNILVLSFFHSGQSWVIYRKHRLLRQQDARTADTAAAQARSLISTHSAVRFCLARFFF